MSDYSEKHYLRVRDTGHDPSTVPGSDAET